jgi:hypothetical protein
MRIAEERYRWDVAMMKIEKERELFRAAWLKNYLKISQLLSADNKNQETARLLIRFGADINDVKEFEKLIRREFSGDGEEDFFKCLVKCLPVLPRLCYTYRVQAYIEGHLWSSTLPDNIEVRLSHNLNNVVIIVQEKGCDTSGQQRRVLNMCCLKEPLVGLIYNRVIEDLEHYDDSDIGQIFVNINNMQSSAKQDLLRLKKQMWYEQRASKPPSLQHCCRFAIRKSMAHSSYITYDIQKLPLPKVLISYLLFESKEIKKH